MNVVVLLVLCGVLALGMPVVRRSDRRRFYHPWVNSGLILLLLGMVAGHFLDEPVRARLRPLLALALAAAGVLTGIQLRPSFLAKAGSRFLRRHSLHALVVFIALAVPLAVLAGTGSDWPWRYILGLSGLIGAMGLATSQAPPANVMADAIRFRDVVSGHVAPAGWWNLLAIAAGGVVLTLATPPVAVPLGAVVTTVWLPVIQLLVPALLGLGLGFLSLQARNRDEAYLFLLALLGVGAGLGLAIGASPLLSGFIAGAVFVNVTPVRGAVVERALEDLEQPVVLAIGLLAGLCLNGVADAGWWASIVGWLAVGRWLMRGTIAPTAAALLPRRERALTTAGATGVLLVGGASLPTTGLAPMVMPLALILVLIALVGQLNEEWRTRPGA